MVFWQGEKLPRGSSEEQGGLDSVPPGEASEPRFKQFPFGEDLTDRVYLGTQPVEGASMAEQESAA